MPRKLGRVAVPTPASAPPGSTGNPLSNLPKPASMLRQAVQLAGTFLRTLATFLFQLPRNTWYYISHPSERRDQLAAWKKIAQHEINHYYTGTKLLVADVRTARGLLTQSLHGDALTRRERKQLLRTVSDLFRLVPFSMFILIPFMEFVLPFALRVFPNLLPSTFQDSLKAEEGMKRELQSRIAMAKFFQETLEELAQEQKRKAVTRRQELQEAGLLMNEEDADASGGDNSRVTTMIEKQEDSAASMLEFLEKSRAGEMLPPDVIIRYAKYFQDDLTLDNMPRMQLINMCKYMNMQPYGSDNFLRFQLRHKIRSLKEDDQRILWEGIDALTKMELREAVQERGMRSVGLSKDAYKRALQQWLDLSVNQSVPIALLIMSRSFFLNEEMPALSSPSKASTSSSSTATASAPASSASTSSSSTKTDSAERVGEMEKSDPSYTGLADAISGLDKEVLNEVILQMATSEEKTSDPEIRKLKLEVVEKQNELIRKEKEDRDAAAAKKKEHAEQQAVAEQAAAAALEPASPSTEDETFASAQASHIVDATATESSTFEANATEEKLEVPKEEQELSTEEMAALRTILTDDPVSSEREALGRIKAAMKGEMEADQREELQQIRETIEGNLSDSDQSQTTSNGMPAVSKEIKTDPMTPEEADAYVSDQIEKEDSATASMSSLSSDIVDEPALEEEPEDPVVARLKKRIESMVDKIEVQLSETKGKIGDKLHFLDKDRDGILSREEVAEVLQQVFKKELSFEEAMEIADEMVSSRVLFCALTSLSLHLELTDGLDTALVG
jgi:LETM1 and EF-hand domain-containing protein 1